MHRRAMTEAAVVAAVVAVVAAVVAVGCRSGEPRPPDPTRAARPDPVADASPRAPIIDDARLAALLRATGATGAALVTDVASGAVVASAAIGRDPAATVLPLSVIKLYVAALWWEHGLDDGELAVRGRRVTVRDVLVDGWDQPGEAMARELRARLGAAAMLAELRGLGLGDRLALPVDADDERWGSALSIGEHDLRVTLAEVAGFLRAIAGGTARLQPATRERLQVAMRETVEHGTAKAAGARLAGCAWRLGGKTGTGPAGADPPDGWFAGLIFEDVRDDRDGSRHDAVDGARPRYAIAVYIEGRGPGGGVAAGLAADVVRLAASR